MAAIKILLAGNEELFLLKGTTLTPPETTYMDAIPGDVYIYEGSFVGYTEEGWIDFGSSKTKADKYFITEEYTRKSLADIIVGDDLRKAILTFDTSTSTTTITDLPTITFGSNQFMYTSEEDVIIWRYLEQTESGVVITEIYRSDTGWQIPSLTITDLEQDYVVSIVSNLDNDFVRAQMVDLYDPRDVEITIENLNNRLNTLETSGDIPPQIAFLITQSIETAINDEIERTEETYLKLAGGEMEGPITLFGDATDPMNPVPMKQMQDFVAEHSIVPDQQFIGYIGTSAIRASMLDLIADGRMWLEEAATDVKQPPAIAYPWYVYHKIDDSTWTSDVPYTPKFLDVWVKTDGSISTKWQWDGTQWDFLDFGGFEFDDEYFLVNSNYQVSLKPKSIDNQDISDSTQFNMNQIIGLEAALGSRASVASPVPNYATPILDLPQPELPIGVTDAITNWIAPVDCFVTAMIRPNISARQALYLFVNGVIRDHWANWQDPSPNYHHVSVQFPVKKGDAVTVAYQTDVATPTTNGNGAGVHIYPYTYSDILLATGIVAPHINYNTTLYTKNAINLDVPSGITGAYTIDSWTATTDAFVAISVYTNLYYTVATPSKTMLCSLVVNGIEVDKTDYSVKDGVISQGARFQAFVSKGDVVTLNVYNNNSTATWPLRYWFHVFPIEYSQLEGVATDTDLANVKQELWNNFDEYTPLNMFNQHTSDDSVRWQQYLNSDAEVQKLKIQIQHILDGSVDVTLDLSSTVDIEEKATTGFTVTNPLGGQIVAAAGTYLLVGTGRVWINDILMFDNAGVSVGIGSKSYVADVKQGDVVRGEALTSITYTNYVSTTSPLVTTTES